MPIGPLDAQDAQDAQDSNDAQSALLTGRYGSGPAYLGIGISPYRVADDETAVVEDRWWPGNQWPPTNPVVRTGAGNGVPVRLHQIYKTFQSAPYNHWSPENESIVILSEFVRSTSWHTFALPNPPVGNGLQDELTELVGLIGYRAGVLHEALQQRRTVIGYFQHIVPFSYISHPWTLRLLHAALRIGQFVAMHHKAVFNRPRPSQLAPALLPPIAVPQHPAYPSGHATEAYLIAHCLNAVMVDTAGDPLLEKLHPASTSAPGGMVRNAAFEMADRIARNREVLGVHYPSDSAAGRELASDTFARMLTCPSVQTLEDGAGTGAGAELVIAQPRDRGLLQLAGDEWAGWKIA